MAADFFFQSLQFGKLVLEVEPAYVNGVSEGIFKVGMCLPAGPYVSDEDVKYIVETIKAAIV